MGISRSDKEILRPGSFSKRREWGGKGGAYGVSTSSGTCLVGNLKVLEKKLGPDG